MQKPYLLALLPAVLGLIAALNAFLAPMGNTGVDGTLGAGLAVIGTVAATLMIGIIAARPLPRAWSVTLGLLALLAALLTAVAGYFLMQTLLAALMAATFALLLVAFFVTDRRVL
ncbi:hypothetical protein [Pseudotabrizicola algicola]|uniref:ABC transporter permease n=1 Tax=Pseudotabrizicola algicola TaxID=2709381 RepID=A0A6B3RRM6_9RHOB|nr:hypothetical protein [Pseudotabrizicola algicola]NEX47953.1 hypothetical protein [Pseudotabrizicola algicola]